MRNYINHCSHRLTCCGVNPTVTSDRCGRQEELVKREKHSSVVVKMVSKVASTARISAVLARRVPLLRLEQQDRAVAQVEVDEVLRLCDSVSPSHIRLPKT